MASAAEVQQFQANLVAMRDLLTNFQAESQQQKDTITALERNLDLLRDQARNGHTDLGTRIGILEQAGPAAAPAQGGGGHHWKLENKGGQLKTFTGEDKTKFRGWVKKLKAFFARVIDDWKASGGEKKKARIVGELATGQAVTEDAEEATEPDNLWYSLLCLASEANITKVLGNGSC